MTVFVIYARLDENFSSPVKAFRDKSDMEAWLRDNKDQYGSEYCYEELDVE